MRKEASLPIRLDLDVKKRLQVVADALGLPVSTLIRILVKSFVEEYERSGGKIVLPPQWQSPSVYDHAQANKRAKEAAPLQKVADSSYLRVAATRK
jgi:hypothetical protein